MSEYQNPRSWRWCAIHRRRLIWPRRVVVCKADYNDPDELEAVLREIGQCARQH
jgi:hypothetical protein